MPEITINVFYSLMSCRHELHKRPFKNVLSLLMRGLKGGKVTKNRVENSLSSRNVVEWKWAAKVISLKPQTNRQQHGGERNKVKVKPASIYFPKVCHKHWRNPTAVTSKQTMKSCKRFILCQWHILSLLHTNIKCHVNAQLCDTQQQE